MSTLLLVLRKDLRLLRLPIAVWLAVLLAQVAFALSRLDESGRQLGVSDTWGTGAFVLLLLHLAALVVVTVSAPQTDPPNAPTAFWSTRPIGPLQLLVAKLLFALLVVVLPWTAANVVVLAGRGFTLPDLLRATTATLLAQGVLVPALLAIGALTGQLPRAIVALIGLVAWITAVGWALASTRETWFQGLALGRGRAADEAASLIGLAVTAVILSSTYGRRPRRATMLVVVGTPLVLMAEFLWPWSYGSGPRALPEPVQLQVTDATRTGLAHVLSASAQPTVQWHVLGAIGTLGVPEGHHLQPVHVDSDLRWADGRRETARILGSVQESAAGQGEPLPIEGLGVVSNLSAKPLWLAAVSPATWEAEQTEGTARANARVSAQLVRQRLLARLPLHAGERRSLGSERIALTRVSLSDAPQVTIHEAGPHERPAVRYDGFAWYGSTETAYAYYAFHNPASGELIAAAFTYDGGASSVPPVAGGLRIEHFRAGVAWPAGDRWRTASAQLAWLSGAELVKVEVTVVAEGERTVELPELRLPALPPAAR
jgi:hypothetical protein